MLIGEVSERSGISARMLRHYDAIGLVQPSGRTQGGYRKYSETDIRRLFHVEGLRSLGLELQEIAGVLDNQSFQPSEMVESLIERTRERLARDERLLRWLAVSGIRIRSSKDVTMSKPLTYSVRSSRRADRCVAAAISIAAGSIGPST